MTSTLLPRTIPPVHRRLASYFASTSAATCRRAHPQHASTPFPRRYGSTEQSKSQSPPPRVNQSFPTPYTHSTPTPPPRSPVTKWVLASPRRTALLLKIGDWLGYGSPKQVAARRAKIIYDVCSEVGLGEERAFWYDALSLPPTLQSWFTITNLHIWLATVRLRAVPAPHGRHLVQALIDYFFLDIEDRLRAVLGKKVPERVVTRHMKILREQWAGLGLALDHALITGDKDMASAMWRNLLGARGARGFAYDKQGETLVDGTQSKPDDASGGVTDFEGPSVQKYVRYPELMLALTSYARRELVRLQDVSDANILGGVGYGMRESILGARFAENGMGSQHGVDPTAAAAQEVRTLRALFRFGRVQDAAQAMGIETFNELGQGA